MYTIRYIGVFLNDVGFGTERKNQDLIPEGYVDSLSKVPSS